MAKLIRNNISYILLFVSINGAVKGTVAIDFEELSSDHTIKVVAYNISTQQMLSYDEINPELSWIKSWGAYTLKYDKGGKLDLSYADPKTTSPIPSFYVRYKHNWQLTNRVTGYILDYQDRKAWSSEAIIEKKPEDIRRCLPPPKQKLTGTASLLINRHKHLGVAETLATLSDSEKGKLGELITTLTFLSFGYCQLPSKYEDNHGIDGIFQSWSGNYLFLTESKQRKKQQTAQNVVAKQLSEDEISDKILRMENYDHVRGSAGILRDFINTKPGNVYKFGHRVANTGEIQYHIASLEIEKFPKDTLKFTGATQAQKIKDIQKTLSAYEDTPEKQLELALRTIHAQGFTQQVVMETFMSRLDSKRYVYLWADGVYLQACMEDEKQCILVIIGATPEGKKELVGFIDGYRESAQSWREWLLDIKARGLSIPPKLAIGDGTMGFWKALEEVWPQTRHQRCWVHKTSNILNKMHKSIHHKAKADIHNIWIAESKETANEAFDLFLDKYKIKYPHAALCLEKDRNEMLTFYDFPAEHWKHIRTTNPIDSTFATIRHRTKAL